MKTRQSMIANLPTGLCCAELGVFAGDFSRNILSIIKPSMLYLVDTFDGTFSSADQNGLNRETLHLPTVEKMLFKELAGRQVQIVKMESIAWLKSMPDSSLDFVYIDTEHGYEQTRAELAESRRVVRGGGLVCGHDYHERFPGVIKAVDELGIPVQLTEDGLPSFMMLNRKPSPDGTTNT